MSNYKKLLVPSPATRPISEAEKCKYWDAFGDKTIIKEFGSIDFIDFCPILPYNFAVTSSVRVQVYNPLTKLVLRNISTFQKQAYGATFRNDGQLICAGDEDTTVRLFDMRGVVIRSFKGHKAPVHRTFFTIDNQSIASFSDDKTVKVWDIATEKVVNNYIGYHTDYVRAGAVNPSTSNTVVSGSYDRTIIMYDTRSNKQVMTIKNDHPLESLVFLPSGGVLVSAGGTEMKVWDIVAGGRQLTSISEHTKTISCLQATSDGHHLISGSLDHHVKFYSTANYQLVKSICFSNSILSVGISKDNSFLGVGQVDGTLVVHQRKQKFEEEKVEKIREKRKKRRAHQLTEEVVATLKLERDTKYDKCLKKFEYSKALDSVLSRYCVNKSPQITVSVMHELLKRQGLVSAFSNRKQDSLARIVTFFNRYISDGRFTRVLIDIVNVFLDIYEKNFFSFGSDLQRLIIELCQRIKLEEQLTVNFLKFEGALEIIMNSVAISNEEKSNLDNDLIRFQPSENAKKATVISL